METMLIFMRLTSFDEDAFRFSPRNLATFLNKNVSCDNVSRETFLFA